MIREDYIISWIKRFIQMLAQIIGLIKLEQYQAAIQAIDGALQTLLDLGPNTLVALSEGEIMARITLGESTQVVQTKCVMLAALLQQLAVACAAQQHPAESRDCYLKALHIMLGVLLREEAYQSPDYAPNVEDLLLALKDEDLPARTYGALMLYYERKGQFARAEDAFYNQLETESNPSGIREIGIAFYERLLTRDDASLVAGNLPRPEIEASLAELKASQGHT